MKSVKQTGYAFCLNKFEKLNMEKYKQKYFQRKPINSLITRLFFALLFNSIHLISFGQNAVHDLTKYKADNHSIVGYNLPLYNNRPLYCNNTDAFILTGDKPLIRFAQTPYIYGTFKAAILHNGKLKWLDDCSSIKMEYRGNIDYLGDKRYCKPLSRY